ncbi:MAG: hypothetical protein GX621_01485, partial [Pirellulaceae bacterium]|nr:hypothetical protein [Pirellulaceae bacterium]
MDKIEKRVRQARRRLGVQRFFDSLAWSWTILLGASILATLVGKFWLPGVPPWGWAVGAIVLGIVAASTWTMLTRPGPIDAAAE